MKNRKAILLILIFGIGVYAGPYLFLSTHGKFEPAIIGLNGVKEYEWAPKGFVHGYKWNHTLENIYFPLLLADNHCWHTFEESQTTNYPVDRVQQKNIGDVDKAWAN
jgi:hypothetical protein